MRYDENYKSWQDSARTVYNRIKYVPLASDKNAYASFGGEARLEVVNFDNEDWGRLKIGSNNFLLQRYDLHGDLHLGERFRIFGQLRSALQGGRKNGPRPIDEDQLNIQNLFLEFRVGHDQKRTLTGRAGRQEMDYGSGRLISVREGPNARLYFTGAKVMYASERLFLDGFIMMADIIRTGVFDNITVKQANLWGAYSKTIVPKAGNLDLYYLGIRRDHSIFEEGNEKELRHTLGGRFWKYGGGFIYNLEAAYQFGKFGEGHIKAWTGSLDIGYLFENVRFKPSINLRHDYISGDKKAGDGNLQTFNPLYPKGGYFGFSPQVGPVNLMDIHPYGTMALSTRLNLQLDVVCNWRYSLSDGVYRPSGTFNLAGSGSKKRYIGTACLASLMYGLNRFISLNTGIQYFKTGGFIDDIIPGSKDGLFINTRAVFKF
ncbi:alginate export family protein [Dyadobacter flavalbus]|nr:alginate export family protein [Dyadobacter flavalbus]